jgi:hypothetical protein
LTARIRALQSKDQGWQNVGEGLRGNGAKRNDLANRNPGGPKARSIYSLVMRSGFCFYILPPVNIPYIFGNNFLNIIPKINETKTPNNIIKKYPNNINMPFKGIIFIYILNNCGIIIP